MLLAVCMRFGFYSIQVICSKQINHAFWSLYIYFQEQYAFVHHAVLEGVYCEKTTFNPGDLSIIMRKMDLVQESTKMNLYEAQFMVSVTHL